LVNLSDDLLAKEAIMDEKKIMGMFFDYLNKKPGMVTYGEAAVREKIAQGVVDKILVSESFGDENIEDIEKAGEQYSSEVVIISTETSEGVQLEKIGKVAAILRYEM